MRGRSALVVFVLALVVGAGACGDDGTEPDDGSAGGTPTTADGPGGVVPTRAPEVSGTITRVGGGGAVRLVDASDPYYEGMGLLRATSGGTVLVVDEGGAVVDVDDLVEGMPVDVWVGSACAESYPVQCGIEALRVDTAG